MIKNIHVYREWNTAGQGDSGNRSRGLCVNIRTKERSLQHRAVGTGKALLGPWVAEESETHHHSECCMGTENSQLPHWLIVSVEKHSHGDQDIEVVSLAENMEICNEARPLQKGLKEKKCTGMRAIIVAEPSLSPSTKKCL